MLAATDPDSNRDGPPVPRLRPAGWREILLALLLGLFAHGAAAGDSSRDADWRHAPYVLGQGLSFPQRQLTLGGYLSLRYLDLDEVDSSLGIKDLSLFIGWEPGDRWNVFAEIEIGDALSISRHGIDTADAEIEIERLYVDYRARPYANLRAGKFLTPVGRWNLIHADPLVWTVSRPLTTAVSFARQASGVMLYGTIPAGAGGIDYSLFVDDTETLDPGQQEERAFEDANPAIPTLGAFRHATGARLAYHSLDERFSLGMSYAHFRMEDLREPKDLIGVDVFWDAPFAELSGEWLRRDSRGGGEPGERGGFAQAVIPLPARLFLIGRYERYRTSVQPETATIRTLGLTYRPHRAVSVKLEYRGGDRNELVSPGGWLGSLAILF